MQISSTAVNATCVAANAIADPTKALATPVSARTRPPGSRRITEEMTWTVNSPTTIGRVTVAMTAMFARNHDTDKSIAVVESSAANVSSPICAAAPMNACPSPLRIESDAAVVADPTMSPAASHSKLIGPTQGSKAGSVMSDPRTHTGEERDDRVRPTNQQRTPS